MKCGCMMGVEELMSMMHLAVLSIKHAKYNRKGRSFSQGKALTPGGRIISNNASKSRKDESFSSVSESRFNEG